jgi:hypothetical protein
MKKTGMLLALLAAALSSCMSAPPTAKDAGVTFKTAHQALPSNLEWAHRGQAHEVLNQTERIVVLSGGSNPIPDDKWEGFKPPFPWQKNIERNLLFQQSAFLGSPGVPDGQKTFITMGGYTWLVLVKSLSIDYIPSGEKVDFLHSAPGHLVVKTIQKNQVLKWDGPEIYQLTDNKGNYYVMHAFEDPRGPTTDVALPAGWTLKKVEITEPLVITPSEAGYYNIVGDCLGQGYHQYIFADSVWRSN